MIKPGPGEGKPAPAAKAAVRPAVASKIIAKSVPAKAAAGKKSAVKKGAAGTAAKKAAKASLAAAAAKRAAKAALAKEPAIKDAAEEEAADAAGDQTEFSGQVSYKIFFQDETAVITQNSEKKLAQVADTMNYYPMAQVKLIGYAYSGEANPQAMAQDRVDYVATRLSGKYNIGSDRMESSTQISKSPKSMIVEIKMQGKE